MRSPPPGLADAVDAFCETIGFTVAETTQFLSAARARHLPTHLHAGQLSDMGAAQLAAEFGALSADHLEYLDADGARALARAGTVAVLLPGAYFTLRQTHPPPIGLLRESGVPLAVATDSNPGTSPCTSMLLMLNMACTLFGLTPEEALAGATRVARARRWAYSTRIGARWRWASVPTWHCGASASRRSCATAWAPSLSPPSCIEGQFAASRALNGEGNSALRGIRCAHGQPIPPRATAAR